MRFELAPFALTAGYGDSVLPLADVKAHLSIDAAETEFDDLIGALRDAAVDMVERYCGVYLAPRVGVVWKAERLCLPLRLGVWPVSAVTAVGWLDGDGADVAGDPAVFRIGTRDELLLKPGQSAPSAMHGGVSITFDAGFAAADRPAALVQAARMFTAHLFANREAVITGTISGEIPLGFKALCGAYRMPVI